MIPEYDNILTDIKSQFEDAGFNLTKNSEFSAEFMTADGWRLVFEGERYFRSLFDIRISFPGEDISYSVGILMKCFFHVNGGDSNPPNAVNQANFIKEHLRGWISKKRKLRCLLQDH